MPVDTILHNAKIATNGVPSLVQAVAIKDGKISAVGKDDEILRLQTPETRVIDGNGRTVIPGLNDSHIHPIRGDSTTTWSCAGMECLRSPTLCAC